MSKRNVLAGSLFLMTLTIALPGLTGEYEWQNPAIKNHGSAAVFENTELLPETDRVQRIVFDGTSESDTPEAVNPVLNKLARIINLYEGAGVSENRRRLAVVVHGGATHSLLTNEHFREEFGVNNPNIRLVRALVDDGVKIYVCGQALAKHGYQPDWLLPGVRLTQTAVFALTALQQKGYALVLL